MSDDLNCNNLVEGYVSWLRSNITVCKVGVTCEITTPFLDRHNDFLQFYAEAQNGGFRVSDDGNTIRDLEQSGVDLASPKRARLLEIALNGFGVARKGDELVVDAKLGDLPLKLHSLLQATLSVNDMFFTAKPLVQTLFNEDVEQFLRSHSIRFTPNIQLVGHSHLIHNFDFVVPASDKAPERIIRAINQPNRDSVTSLLFAWNDTKKARPAASEAYVFINDESRAPSASLIGALEEYAVKPVIWSQREAAAEKLAA